MHHPGELPSLVHKELHEGLGIEEDEPVEKSDHYERGEGSLRRKQCSDIPAAAWSRRLDDLFPGHKQFKVSVMEGLRLVGLGYRMWKYLKREESAGRVPIMDPFDPPKAGPIMGVPLGGIGGGTIGRGWRGEFVKWQLQAGMTNIHRVDADQFSAFVNLVDEEGGPSTPIPTVPKKVSTVLYPGKPKNPSLSGWNWGLKGNHSTYHALYPLAWTVYDEVHPNIRLVCKQISPVFPHEYEQSSFPASVFVWKIENDGPTAADVSLMFTWQNGTGTIDDRRGGHYNNEFLYEPERDQEHHGASGQESEHVDGMNTSMSDINLEEIFGITLHHKRIHYVKSPSKHVDPTTPKSDTGSFKFQDPLSFAIAVKKSPGVEVSYNLNWETTNPNQATALWRDFSEDGVLSETVKSAETTEMGKRKLSSTEAEGKRKLSKIGIEIGAAIAAKVRVPPGESREIVFCLAWDTPIARFGMGTAYYRRYTRYFGRDGNAASQIALHALGAYRSWEEKINKWQKPILENPRTPLWYKMGLINEMYYIVDGGTIWTNGRVNAPEEDTEIEQEDYIGHFAYLESQEYLMYNTYDVHFYASFALAQLWPRLELSLQRDVAFATLSSDPQSWQLVGSGAVSTRKTRGAVPHDMGNPGEDPWIKVNSYNIQDIGRWKDLPSKFVLQVYRDFICTGDDNFLNEMWSIVVEVLDRLCTFDVDLDGIVDNEGFPDQTYDTWNVTGCSAYSGGLFLAALQAASAMANLMNHPALSRRYQAIFERGQATFEEKLWNGKYYNYDCSPSTHHDSIMADQLAGHWYSKACGLPGIVPDEHAKLALQTIYDNNVMKFGKGEIGAVNGMRPNGSVDTTCLQSSEVWTGTTYGVAAAMIQEGLTKAGFDTAKGIVLSTYKKWGYQFQTPEAWDINGNYRAFAYMRPLSIWAIHWALNRPQTPPL